jgi:hypothetical protein
VKRYIVDFKAGSADSLVESIRMTVRALSFEDAVHFAIRVATINNPGLSMTLVKCEELL